MISDNLVQFLHTLGSVWALRLLLILSAEPTRAWYVAELVREMRASVHVMDLLLPRFVRLGLVTARPDGRWIWRPATPELEGLARDVATAYAVTPFAVIEVIAEARENNIRQFAEAFRFRRK